MIQRCLLHQWRLWRPSDLKDLLVQWLLLIQPNQ
jgi:hypothetical protein